jgi:hypothetical protein
MAGKKGVDNSKKAAGNARKAESAAKKSAAADAARETAESEKWQQGSKNTSKKYVRTWHDGALHGIASHACSVLASPGWLRVPGARFRCPL